MTDWTAGYVADIGYTFGYYTELNPLRVKLAFLNAGLTPPEIGTACELGFGQGMSANLHAAGSVTRWHGTDFNPSQAAFAQELAHVSGNGASLFDEAFEQFADRKELPEFDYIGLHGIWSWISDANRAVIVDFIRRKLKVGGVLYISYNTLPGWAAFAPMRHLMTEHANTLGADGVGIVNRIDTAIDFATKLIETNPLYARANPQIKERLSKLAGQNRHYLAHEYFNKDWHPMHFATMAEWLEPAKLSYACSANYLDHIDAVNLSAEQQKLLAEIPDANFKQSTRDFMVNQQFRKDYWVKGGRKLTPLLQAEMLRKVSVILATPKADISLKVNGALGEANLTETVYGPILDALSDHKPQTLNQIEKSVAPKGISFAQVLQACMVLTGAGHVQAAQDEPVIQKCKKQTEKLNHHLMSLSRDSNEYSYLVSPVTGGGITVGRFNQLFLLGKKSGHKSPEDWAKFTWQVLASQGQKLVKEGKTLDTPEANLTELTAQAKAFQEKQLPILKALQID